MAKRENITDLFVIGGGLNGCAIARDAAGRGYSVFLAEMGDLASGSSSTTTKLLDGAMCRLELGQIRLAREELVEREQLRAMAPHIISPLRLVLPHHKGLRGLSLRRLRLLAYDHLGANNLLPKTRVIDLRSDPLGRPLKDGHTRAFAYSGCWVDDARLVVLTARDAADKGAIIQVRTKVTSAIWENGLWTIRLHDSTTNLRGTVKARVLVNAAGPWADVVLRDCLGRGDVRHVRLSKTTNIVVRRLFDHDHAYVFEKADGRVLYAIPYQRDFTLITGPAEDFEGDPQNALISESEMQASIKAAGELFERPLTRADVVWSYAGILTRLEDRTAKEQRTSVDHAIVREDGPGPLISAFGGTTAMHRRIAEEVLDHVEAARGARGKAWTRSSKLPGGNFAPHEFGLQIEHLNALYPNLPDRFLQRLARQYGTNAATLLGTARRMQDLGELFGVDLTQREVEYLIAHEWARSADDILWRRTKLGLRMTAGDRSHLEAYFRNRRAGATK